jgi:hypothetical protein
VAQRARSAKFSPGIPSGYVLAEVATHAEAGALVSKLVAADFPAREISILGLDVKLVERIRGRLGYGRVALSGAIAGSWLGMLFAILFGVGLSSSGGDSQSFAAEQFIAAIVIGIGLGIIANIVRFSLSSAKPSYISASFPVAQRYQVIVPNERASEASRLLQQ